MKKRQLDALVSLSPENSHYVSGTYNISHHIFRDRRPILTVIPRDSEPTLICQQWELRQTTNETWIHDIRTYEALEDHVTKHPINILSEAMTEKDLAKKRIGLEIGEIAISDFDRLRMNLPDATLVEANDIFREMRMVKSDDEIRIMKYAAQATETAMNTALQTARKGNSEIEIARRMCMNLMERGPDLTLSPSYFLTLGSGERTLINHPSPTDKRITEGETVLIDFGGIFSGYHSDISGVAVVGQPNQQLKDAYEKLLSVYVETASAARPGLTGSQVFQVYVNASRRSGLMSNNQIFNLAGHGIGLEIHEDPVLGPSNSIVLKEKMLVCMEVVHRVANELIAIEDLAEITANGARFLSQVQDEIITIN